MMTRLFLTDFVACDKCALCNETHVPGRGNPLARIMIVGEAPGATESKMQLPFVGRAGKMLYELLAKADIDPDSVYLSNTVKCRPPENRKPTPEEIKVCRTWLEREIALVRPKVIVALGATAAAGFGFKDSISKVRGHLAEYGGVKVVPTFHPAYLLRNSGKISFVIADLVQSLQNI
jgi:uracil-DNA glycosylase family 4